MRLPLVAALIAASACSSPPAGAPALPATPAPAIKPGAGLTDHHVHILSPDLVRDWKALGVPFSRPDSVYTSASAALGPGGAERVILVPMGYLYGREGFRDELGLSLEEEVARVRHENDHAAAEAARFPGRAVAFCGVDPLRPYAWDEIHRCRDALGTRGLKLHLASAGVDVRNDEHLAALAQIAAWSAEESHPLMMHVDPQMRGLEADDVRRFIRVVLQPVPDLRIVIPHLGGSGGYGPWTQSVVGVFADWLEAEARAGVPRPGVRFDLSAVWLVEESEGVPASTPAQAARLRDDLRRLGHARLLLGSDYPVFQPGASAEALRVAVGWTDDEWRAIVAQRLDVFGR